MLRYLFYALAFVQFIVGALYLALPEAVNAQFGALNPVAIALARFYGATLLPLAFVSWVAANAGASSLRLALVRASAIIPLLGLVVTLVVIPGGMLNATQAATQILIGVVFILGFGYYGWIRPSTA